MKRTFLLNCLMACLPLILLTQIAFINISCNGQSTTQIIAHRGFWKTDGSAQNSLASLCKADSIACYGSEFDVWMTADKQLVVNHDKSFKGVVMEKDSLNKCTSVILDNGENMPTLKQYLEKAKSMKTKLIFELKSLSTPEDETLAVEKAVQMIKEMGLESRTEYIAFSAHATREFIRLASKGTPVYYLNGDVAPKELKEWGCTGMDYNKSVIKEHPEWIDECHRLGMKVNVWTVNDEEDMKWMIEHKVDFITTDNPLLLHKLLNK